MGINLRLGVDDWGIIFTWDSFQPSTPEQFSTSRFYRESMPRCRSRYDEWHWHIMLSWSYTTVYIGPVHCTVCLF